MSEQAKILVFLGSPGAGKGTVAAWLASRGAVRHLSTGDVLRKAVKEGTEVGRIASTYMSEGKLVPDEVIIDVLFESVEGFEGPPLVLDGFPRTLPQAEALEERLASLGTRVDRCVLFEIEDEAVIRRLSSRLVCSSCGATYNAVAKPPAREGVCDACGSAVVRRRDDEPEAIQERLRVYREATEPLVDHYEASGVLVRVDAGREMDEVRRRVREILELS